MTTRFNDFVFRTFKKHFKNDPIFSLVSRLTLPPNGSTALAGSIIRQGGVLVNYLVTLCVNVATNDDDSNKKRREHHVLVVLPNRRFQSSYRSVR